MPEYLFALVKNRFWAAKHAANPKKTACLACHCCYNTTRQIGSSNAEKGSFLNAIEKMQYDIRKWRI